MKMKKSAKFYLPFIVCCLVLVSCEAVGRQPTTGTIEPSAIATTKDRTNIQFIGNESRQVRIESIPQNNCGGTAEVENVFEKSRSVTHIMEVGTEISVDASGAVKILGTGIDLGAQIAAQLGYGYGTEENLTRSITVKASPGSNMEHKIGVKEVWEKGNATVEVDGLVEYLPFSFRTDFTLELIDSLDLGCESESDTLGTILEPTLVPEVTDSPQPLPTSTSVPTPEFTCPITADSPENTVRMIVIAETQAALDEDFDTLRAVYFSDAVVSNNGQIWNNPIQHYIDVFKAYDLIEVTNSDINVTLSANTAAYVTRTSDGKVINQNNGQVETFTDDSGQILLRLDQNGCWRISQFDKAPDGYK